MKIKNDQNDQLELTLQNQRAARLLVPHQRRMRRAALWFDRMRRVVESAIDREPARIPRPEQIWFPNPR